MQLRESGGLPGHLWDWGGGRLGVAGSGPGRWQYYFLRFRYGRRTWFEGQADEST